MNTQLEDKNWYMNVYSNMPRKEDIEKWLGFPLNKYAEYITNEKRVGIHACLWGDNYEINVEEFFSKYFVLEPVAPIDKTLSASDYLNSYHERSGLEQWQFDHRDLTKMLNEFANLRVEQAKEEQRKETILMNILEDNYELNEQFHKEARGMIYSFVVAHYDEKLTLNEWLVKFYNQR